MAKASELFRQSDLNRWGIVALVSCAFAVFAANVGAAIPSNVLAALHTPRSGGADGLRLDARVSALEQVASSLGDRGQQLATRLSIVDQTGADLSRRVVALETALPQMAETVSSALARPPVDFSAVTASIAGGAETLPAEGGSVVVTRQPLALAAPPAEPQALPEIPAAEVAAAPGPAAYGVALGPLVSAASLSATWTDISGKLGPLLLGLSPLVAASADGGGYRLVAGPFTAQADATAMCSRLERIGMACLPVAYEGEPLLR